MSTGGETCYCDVPLQCKEEKRADAAHLGPAAIDWQYDHCGFREPNDYLKGLLTRIRRIVLRDKIDLFKEFKPHDILKNGCIPAYQFASTLRACLGLQADLKEEDVEALTDYFTFQKCQVNYEEFCKMTEKYTCVEELTPKEPLPALPCPYSSAWVPVKDFTDAEKEATDIVVKKIACTLRKKQLLILPSQEYGLPRSSGVYTVNHFRQALTFLDIMPSPVDFSTLCKFYATKNHQIDFEKFANEVNLAYSAWCCKSGELDNPFVARDRDLAFKKVGDPAVDVNEVLDRIRFFVHQNRLRLPNHFQDFDPLRSGKMSASRFRRCLSTLGLSNVGKLPISELEIQELIKAYTHPVHKDMVLWSTFEKDIDAVNTVRALEKNPLLFGKKPEGVIHRRRFGAVDWQFEVPDQVRELGEGAMARLSEWIHQRRLDIKPMFRDYDRQGTWHITNAAFQKTLGTYGLPLRPNEVAALVTKYGDSDGFNYQRLLDDLYPPAQVPHMYQEYIGRRKEINRLRGMHGIQPEDSDLELIQQKIKVKLCRERINMLHYFDTFDRFRNGKISKDRFRRAINMSCVDLNPREMEVLQGSYQCQEDPLLVNYRAFMEEMESVWYVPELEKYPLLKPAQHVPPDDWSRNYLTTTEHATMVTAMRRLADRTAKRRILIRPPFQDYDTPPIGLVCENRFRRAMKDLGLEQRITPTEMEAICKRYRVVKGGRSDVDYRAFCATIEGLPYIDIRNTPYNPMYKERCPNVVID